MSEQPELLRAGLRRRQPAPRADARRGTPTCAS